MGGSSKPEPAVVLTYSVPARPPPPPLGPLPRPQVSTRFLSACPALYWYMAHLHTQGRYSQALWAYCLTYCVLGAVLMPNFYPWT